MVFDAYTQFEESVLTAKMRMAEVRAVEPRGRVEVVVCFVGIQSFSWFSRLLCFVGSIAFVGVDRRVVNCVQCYCLISCYSFEKRELHTFVPAPLLQREVFLLVTSLIFFFARLSCLCASCKGLRTHATQFAHIFTANQPTGHFERERARASQFSYVFSVTAVPLLAVNMWVAFPEVKTRIFFLFRKYYPFLFLHVCSPRSNQPFLENIP